MPSLRQRSEPRAIPCVPCWSSSRVLSSLRAAAVLHRRAAEGRHRATAPTPAASMPEEEAAAPARTLDQRPPTQGIPTAAEEDRTQAPAVLALAMEAAEEAVPTPGQALEAALRTAARRCS